MNHKANRQFQETERRVEKALMEIMRDEPPERVTVREICERAGVHRTTFYGHYEDVPTLFCRVRERMYEDMMEHFVSEGGLSLREGFLHLFGNIRDRREFYRAYMLAAPRSMANGLLPGPLEEHLQGVISALGYDSREELLYHQTFFCEGLRAVLLRWIERGCPEEPEWLLRLIEREYDSDRGALFG